MPWAVPIVTTIIGTRAQSKANERAADVEEHTSAEALAFAREQEANRRDEWERAMAAEEAQWNAEQDRREPYRQASRGALADLYRRAGYGELPESPQGQAPAPNFNRPMPEGWQPGDPIPTDGPPDPGAPAMGEPDQGFTNLSQSRSYAPTDDQMARDPMSPRSAPGTIREEAYRPLARQPLSAMARARRVR